MPMKNEKLKQISKNRRKGMAIEMAVLFMLVVVALSGLAVSASMMQVNKIDRAYERIDQRVVLDRIGEAFCSQRERYTLSQELDAAYDITKTGTSLQVFPKGETTPVLTVELTFKEGVYVVTKWSYGE